MTSHCNDDEAIHANLEGRKFLRMGNFAKAVKLFEISLRLVDNQDVRQNLASAKAAFARESRNDSDRNGLQGPDIMLESPISEVRNMMNNIPLIRQITRLESRFIAPAAKNYVRGMMIIILVLLFWKAILGR